MDEYHADKEHMTRSALLKFKQTPSKYKAWIDGDVDEKETDALVDGNLLHLSTLKPDIFERDYFIIVSPKFGDCRKKDNKNARDAWRAENPHWDSPNNLGSKYKWCKDIADRVRRHPTAAKILCQGEAEKEFRREIETLKGDKVKCKCRFDWIDENAKNKLGEPLIIAADLKFVREDAASAEKFWWHATKDYLYHLQEAFYGKVRPFDVWYFIVIEKTVPYDMAVYTLPKHLIIDADIEIDELLQRYADCKKEDNWPSYPVNPSELEDPRRARR